MINIFEISELPTVENTSSIVKEGMKIKTVDQPVIKGRTSILKVLVNKQPYYHFSSVEFNSELATRNSNVVIGGKRFYEGIKGNSMLTRLSLVSI